MLTILLTSVALLLILVVSGFLILNPKVSETLTSQSELTNQNLGIYNDINFSN